MRIVHKLLVRSLVHRAGSKERCQKRDMWIMSALEESRGYLNNEEVAKCLKPIKCETWTVMLENELDEGTHSLIQTEQENASLNEIERKDVWRDLMLMRNTYILEHSASILHHVDQSKFAYPAYEPPNVPPYPYPYVPYPHPYTHYPNTGSPSFGGDHYGAHVCKTRTFSLGDKPHSFFAPEGKPSRRGLNPRPLACVPNGESGGLTEGRLWERCGGNGGRGGSMSRVGERKVDVMGRMGGVLLTIRLMVSNDGRGDGGLVVEGGSGEVNGRGVDLGVSKRLLLEVVGDMIGDTGGIEVGEVGEGSETQSVGGERG
nr:hypothetical protein [Tanacetum cinerariifolium]